MNSLKESWESYSKCVETAPEQVKSFIKDAFFAGAISAVLLASTATDNTKELTDEIIGFVENRIGLKPEDIPKSPVTPVNIPGSYDA